jgi:hypothetical protein
MIDAFGSKCKQYISQLLVVFSTLDTKYQNKRSMSSTEKALMVVFKEICTMVNRINLPNTIVDRANNMFK